MRETKTSIEKYLLIGILCCIFGILSWNTAVFAADSYPFEKYYDPDEDEWANEERVTMDGTLDFTVPDMAIQSMDLIVYGTDDPKIDTLKNSNGDSVECQKEYGDDSTYTYYTVSDVTQGDWELQLRGGDWEDTKVYLIYYSVDTAQYSIEKEVKDPDSGNYQILIRLYDDSDEVLSFENRTVRYLIDDRSLMSETTLDTTYQCYMGQPGLNEDSMEILGDDYSCHVIITAENGDIVLLQAERADKNEFKDIKKAYNPSLLERFQAKSAEERRTMLLIAGSLLILFLLAIVILKKTKVTRKQKKTKNKEERYQQTVYEGKRLKDHWEQCLKIRESIWKVSEEAEEYEIWLDSLISAGKREKYDKIISDEFFDILKLCVERAETAINEWENLRQSRKRISEKKEKEYADIVTERRQILEDVMKTLTRYNRSLCNFMFAISKFEKNRMYQDISFDVTDGRNRYSGMIEAQELGMPRKKGIQILNDINLRGSRKITFDDLDCGDLALAVGFTSDTKNQKPVLISNRELFSEEVDMEELRKQGDCFFGPYQYTQFQGLELYMEDHKEIRFLVGTGR